MTDPEADAEPRAPRGDLQIPAADELRAPVTVVAADSTVLYVNIAAAHAVGAEPGWLVGRRLLDLVHLDDQPRLEAELHALAAGARSSGFITYRLRASPQREWRVMESIADNLLDEPSIGGILISSRDVTDERARRRELHDAAYRDALTGLVNRARVTDHVRSLLARGAEVAVAFVDIDQFKLVNDSLGLAAGDAALQAISVRTRAVVPEPGMVGRFDGDLFAIVLTANGVAAADEIVCEIVERASAPLLVGGHELRLSASAGIAHATAPATAEAVLRDAGFALHHAKTHGGGQVVRFEAEMAAAATARLALEADLRRAVARSEFVLALQPVIRLGDMRPVHAEALLRWPATEPLAPWEFVTVAEQTGLIVPLGDWIIERAAQLSPIAPDGQVMVNLSARQLALPGLPERIARVLATYELAPGALGFEVTETLLIEHFDFAIGVLSAIRRLGCRVGLDDFGTGFSSLNYLRRLPIDFLKLDGSFSADVHIDPQANAIVGAIITMADALRLDVIAEGVETEAQADALRNLGCGYAQGYLFGRPVPYD